MDIHKCQFCGHGNPADAKYCSDCGGCLYLVPCPSCGAVNDVKAGSCYECHGQMQAGNVAALDSAAPVAVISKPESANILSRALDVGTLDNAYPLSPAGKVAGPFFHRHARVIVGTAVLAGIAVLGYYGYRQHTRFDASPPTAAGGDPPASMSPANAGVIRRDALAVDSALAKAEVPVIAATQVPLAGAASAEAACTETAATLGLCPALPAQQNAAETATAIHAVNARPDATEPSIAGRTESLRQTSCNDAAAALGLCMPAPAVPNVPAVTHTQRKE